MKTKIILFTSGFLFFFYALNAQKSLTAGVLKELPNEKMPVSFTQETDDYPDAFKAEKNRPNEDKGVLGVIPDEVMPDTYMRHRINVLERVRSHAFTRNGSVLDWRKAMPIGNGDFGASVHGYPDNLTWHISKNDVWWNNLPPSHQEVYPSMNLEEIRRRIISGDSSTRESIRQEIRDTLQKYWGDAGTGRAHQTSCARFTLQLCRSAVFYGPPTEKLDLERGVAISTFRANEHSGSDMSGQVESFITPIDDVLAIRAMPQGDDWGIVRFEFSRDPMEPSQKAPKISAEEIDKLYQPKAHIQDGLAWFEMDLRGEDAYSVALTFDAPGVELYVEGPDIFARGRTGKVPIKFYISVVSIKDTPDHAVEARRRVERAKALGWDELLERHENWWANFWQRSWVALPNSVHERPWYWGLYRAASARRAGKVCPPYTPPWQASNTPSWGLYLLTYETTRAVMGLLATNHAELMEPWLALLDRAREPLRPYVRKHFGIEGIAYPHSITWRGYPIQTITCDGHQGLAASGESVKYAWDYYEFTEDIDFLRRVGYPMLKDLAIFYHNYLTKDDQGNLVVFPSHYLESAVYLTNCIADVSMIRLILRNAAKAADVLGVDTELAADWRNAMQRIRSYDTLPDGRWKTALEGQPSGESDSRMILLQLHDLYPISIGEEVDAWHGTSAMRRQARATYEYYLGNHPFTWDLSLSYIAAARMGDRDYAEKILSIWPKIRDGGNINKRDNPDSPDNPNILNEPGEDGRQGFVVDITSAVASEFITELMLQSHGGDIRLFPAIPLQGDYAFHSLRARGAFLVSSEMRDGKVPYALIQSLAGNTCNIVQPFGKGVDVRIRDLESNKIIKEIFNTDQDEIITFETTIKHIYVIERKDIPLDKVPVVEL